MVAVAGVTAVIVAAVALVGAVVVASVVVVRVLTGGGELLSGSLLGSRVQVLNLGLAEDAAIVLLRARCRQHVHSYIQVLLEGDL